MFNTQVWYRAYQQMLRLELVKRSFLLAPDELVYSRSTHREREREREREKREKAARVIVKFYAADILCWCIRTFTVYFHLPTHSLTHIVPFILTYPHTHTHSHTSYNP